MRKADLVILVSLIAVSAAMWGPLQNRQSATRGTPSPTTSPNASRPARFAWSVDGVSLADTPATLAERFGPAIRVDKSSEVDQYWFRTSAGEPHVSYFHSEKSVGVMGDHLHLNGKAVVSKGDKEEVVRRQLGAPTSVQEEKDFAALQYSGARVYLKQGSVSGVVIEGYPGQR